MFVLEISLAIFLPALGFFIINVFIPGPNVLNTIATSMGSGRSAGIACALATGTGVLITALLALFGAALLFSKIPIIYQSMTLLGAILLLIFSKRYILKSLSPPSKISSIEDIDKKIAFKKAFLVLMTNPKMMTTWLAVISLFPIVASTFNNVLIFSIMTGICSFSGHVIFATIFSSNAASKIYIKLYRPINAFVGIGFIIYSFKLFLSLIIN